MPSKSFTITLNVARVDRGGNAGSGQYFYSYGPDIVLVDASPAQLSIQLGADTPADFRMIDLIATDAQGQLSAPSIAADGRSLTVQNKNTVKQLILVNVLVSDATRGQTIVCDPQVLNRPLI